jgi:hypothetical protein
MVRAMVQAMALPELFPPPGFYRIDEAYRRWMDAVFGNATLSYAEIDAARLEFTRGLRQRRESVNVVSENGTRHEIPDLAWEEAEFPDLLVLHRTIPSHSPPTFRNYIGGIIVIDKLVLEEWTKAELVSPGHEKQVSLVKALTRGELEAAYKQRVANWPTDADNPTEREDLEFLRTLNPKLSRDRVRAIRNNLAPAAWKVPGRRKSRE